MPEIFVSKNDINNINELVKCARMINKVYNELYNLEINNKKDTKEYKDRLDYLKNLIMVENFAYRRCCLDYDKAFSYSTYLKVTEFHDNFIDNETSLFDLKCDKVEIRRVINKLLSFILGDEKEIKKVLFSSKKEILKESIKSLDDVMPNSIKKTMMFNKAMKMDSHNSFINVLQSAIEKSPDKIGFPLIKTRYNYIYLNSDLEEEMIKKDFKIDEDITITSRFVADFIGIPKEAYQDIIDSTMIPSIFVKMVKLLNIDDESLIDKNNYIRALLLQSYVRANLLTLSDDAIEDLNIDYHNIIEDKGYIKKHPSTDFTIGMTDLCFTGLKRVRNKLKIITFGKSL